MYLEAGAALHPALGLNLPLTDVSRLKNQRILFVCTHNSARSQMAGRMLRHLSQGSLDVLKLTMPSSVQMHSYDGRDLRSVSAGSGHSLTGYGMRRYVITFAASREVCRAFPVLYPLH
ncbi:MAG: hypothetical protein U0694_12420 [Anaerolineae bacterium]